jgi:hypothetical protein
MKWLPESCPALLDYAELLSALFELSPANLAFALQRRGLPARREGAVMSRQKEDISTPPTPRRRV